MYYVQNNDPAHGIDNMGDWRPNLPQDGRWELYIYIPGNYATTTQARYEVYHADGRTDVTVNQMNYSNAWVSLGTFHFSAGTGGYLRLTDITNEPYISKYIGFDAAKWEFRGAITPSWEGYLDQPGAGASVSYDNTVFGWVWDKAQVSPIARVEILINGEHIGDAAYGQPRPDIGPNSNLGFTYSWDSRRWVGQTVTVTAHVVNQAGQSCDLTSANVQVVNVPPNTPTDLSPSDGALQSSRTVAFSWKDAGDPDNGPLSNRDYAVQVYQPDGAPAEGGASGWVTDTAWSWTAPADGTWSWDVCAGDGANESARTAKQSFTVDATPPDAPSGLTATPADASHVALAWSASSDNLSGIDHYIVWRNGSKLTETTGTSFTDESCAAGEQYQYAVSAVDKAGNESEKSTVGDAKISLSPDMLVAAAVDQTFVGDGVYNDTGTDQSKTQVVSAGATAIYILKAQNDGNIPDTLTLSGVAGGSGWKIAYFDASTGGNDITAQVTSSGWSIGQLAPGESKDIRVEATPDASVPAGSHEAIRIAAVSAGNSAVQDAVLAATTVAPATQLAFTVQPSNTTAGAAIAPAIQVTVQDQFGNIVPTAANSITVALSNGGDAVLAGTTAVNAVNGVAALSGLSLNKAAKECTLVATADGLTSATSAAFDVSSRSPAVPELLSPAADATASATPLFILKTTDPDGDQVKLKLELSQGSSIVSVESEPVASGAEARIALTLGQALASGQWSWRAKAVDSNGVESEWSAARQLNVPVGVPDVQCGSGLGVFGLPINAAGLSLADLGLQGARIAAWDPATQQYIFDAQAEPLRAGVGYWVKSDAPRPVRCAGISATDSFPLDLKSGWNLVSAPFNVPVNWDLQAIKVQRAGETKTLADATAAGWIEDYAFVWNADQSRYTLVYGTTLANALHQMDPWRAYWVKAKQECRLLLPASGESRMGLRERTESADGWSVRILARAASGAAEAVLGISHGGRALTISEPPQPPEADMSLKCNLYRGEEPLVVDVRESQEARQEWELVVGKDAANGRSTTATEQITLSWPDLRGLPKDVSLILLDTATGARRYFRTASSYTFQATGEMRRFRVVAEPCIRGSVLLSGLRVMALRGSTRAIEFNLSANAMVDLSVVSPSGRVVAEVTRSRSCVSGHNQVVWTGMAAPGIYLLRATATNEDGLSTQTIQPVIMTR